MVCLTAQDPGIDPHWAKVGLKAYYLLQKKTTPKLKRQFDALYVGNSSEIFCFMYCVYGQ